MNDWAEERCRGVRIALRIPGFPNAYDAIRLEEWLYGCIRSVYADVPRATMRFDDANGVATLPKGRFPEELERKRVEECAHFLLGDGLGSQMRTMVLQGSRAERVARRNEGKDEGGLGRFLAEWFLPAELLWRMRPEDVAEESRQEWTAIRKRYAELRGRRAPAPFVVPQWAAAQQYELQVRRGAPMPLLVTPRGGTSPEYQFPVIGSFEDAAFQIRADLCALTPLEFRLKYAYDAIRTGIPVEIPDEELLVWAGMSADG